MEYTPGQATYQAKGQRCREYQGDRTTPHSLGTYTGKFQIFRGDAEATDNSICSKLSIVKGRYSTIYKGSGCKTFKQWREDEWNSREEF
ncbi:MULTISPECIES: hypothetical protein [unclassified Streptomyces]|uniref:hypothetical protein n=1 Tax=unclassified Streptomyces TaxID=2593676 RepID=UPI002E195A18|nr:MULTISPECIES: hypothetical protein [unclassified Streptomyces]